MSGERVQSAGTSRNDRGHRAVQDQAAVPADDQHASVSASPSSHLTERLVPRSSGAAASHGAPAPRAQLPAQRVLTPAQQQQIEKHEKKQVAMAAAQTVDGAMAYLRTFDQLWTRGLVTVEKQQRTLWMAFQSADRGIAAFKEMTELHRAGEDGRTSFVALYNKRAALAATLVGYLPPLPAEAGYSLSQRMLQARSEPVDLPALDRDLHAYLGQVDLAVEAIEPYLRATSEAIENLSAPAHLKAYPTMTENLKEAILTLTNLRLRAFDLHKEQIWTLCNRMVVAEGLNGTEILRETVALLTCAANLSDAPAIDLLQDARIPRQQPMVGRMENGALLLREHAETFIVLASRHFDTETGASQSGALDFAKRLVAAVGALAQQCDAVLNAHKVSYTVGKLLEGNTFLGHPTRRETAALPDDDAQSDLVLEETAASGSACATRPTRSGMGKARKAFARNKADQETAPALSLRQTVVLELAQERLKTFPAPKLGGLRGPGDLLALAESMHKDASAISAAMDPRTEPLSAVRQMRQTLDGWFGVRGQWQARREQLAAAGVAGMPSVSDALQALNERIAAIEGLHRSVDAIGADLIKTFPYPDLKHVSHLLNMATDAESQGSAPRIGAPRKLPSHGDPDHRHGTLFEVKIDTGKLADGRPAPALYVHLHAKAPITAEACRTVPFEALDAFHVKTADQRGKGPTWELLNDALHSVHRGVLDAEVLKALQHRMAGP
ncbi:hypothetical protein [Acidovorax sp. SUPP950]|uniref:hypothetical protein n=1 Tax=Acidovorax sp. SUPP950 TaxID=511901 RepID=UPI0024E0EE81|nr:hypothetical protein [Acidovorax sp. SUPP950]